MNKQINFNLLKLLVCVIILAAFLIYFSFIHGVATGFYLTILLWSLYILSIPGGHGQLIFGIPARMITINPIYPETFLWSAALIFNIITVSLYSGIYSKSLLTYFFYQLINNPNPNWLIFILAAVGTFYNFFFHLSYFDSKPIPHNIIRPTLIFIILAISLYLSHQEIIICMNILA